MAFAPSPTLFRHFIEEAQGRRAVCTVAKCMRSCVTGTTIILMGCRATRLCGGVAEQPKWVVSRSLKSVGPNARLIDDDLEGAIRELKASATGRSKLLARTCAKPH